MRAKQYKVTGWISIHAPRVGSDVACRVEDVIVRISIHAPRVGSDPADDVRGVILNISIHAPRVGSDHGIYEFVSPDADFNPRSPRGERPGAVVGIHAVVRISIHAPRVGSDSCRSRRACIPRISIHAPRVGSDAKAEFLMQHAKISIHAPRVGSDQMRHTLKHFQKDFNPRSPRGERLVRPSSFRRA